MQVKRLMWMVLGVLVLLFCLVGAGYSAWVWHYVTVVPFEYNPKVAQGIVLKSTVQGKELRLLLRFEYDDSYINTSLEKELVGAGAEKRGTDRLAATTSLGNYQRKQFYGLMDMSISPVARATTADGRLGGKFFTASSSFETDEPKLAPRLTFDFVAKTLKIDRRPHRPRLVPPQGTLQAPITLREGEENYYVTLSVNGAPPVHLRLDMDEYMLVSSFAKPPSPTLPITLQFGKQQVNVQNLKAVVWKHYPYAVEDLPDGHLGLLLFSQYRIVLDYEEKMLYLEPPNSSEGGF